MNNLKEKALFQPHPVLSSLEIEQLMSVRFLRLSCPQPCGSWTAKLFKDARASCKSLPLARLLSQHHWNLTDCRRQSPILYVEVAWGFSPWASTASLEADMLRSSNSLRELFWWRVFPSPFLVPHVPPYGTNSKPYPVWTTICSLDLLPLPQYCPTYFCASPHQRATLKEPSSLTLKTLFQLLIATSVCPVANTVAGIKEAARMQIIYFLI